MNQISVPSSIERILPETLDDFLFGHFGEFGIFVKEYFESGLEKGKELRVIDFDDTVWKRQTALDELGKGAKLNRQEKGISWLIAKYCGLFEKLGEFAGKEKQEITKEVIEYIERNITEKQKKRSFG